MTRYNYVSGNKKVQMECWALPAFILALLFGGEVRPSGNPNEPGDLTAFDDDSLRLVIDEGRAQISCDANRDRPIEPVAKLDTLVGHSAQEHQCANHDCANQKYIVLRSPTTA